MIEFILERLILQAYIVVCPGGIKAVSIRIEVSSEMSDAAGLTFYLTALAVGIHQWKAFVAPNLGEYENTL